MAHYGTSVKKFSPRTFNKHLKHYTAWVNWVKEEYGYAIKNHFETINRKTTSTDPQTITQEEYERLLERITFENGIQKYSTQKKLQRNFYRPWLADGIRLGLETGRRREEVSRLKFSDIVHDKRDGSLLHIKVEDFKVNRIQGRTDEQEKKYNPVPITDSLMELLNKLGYEELKGTDKYILAPDDDIDRVKGMPDALSRGFTHYYKLLNTDRELTYKCLRKTYITNLEIFMGGNAKAIVGHADDKVIQDHYLNKEAVARVAKGFQIFSSEAQRKDELENIRNEAKQKTKEQTLTK